VTTERPLPEELFTGLDREGATPLYSQVSQRIEALISDGTLPAGTRLENEIAMGERFGLSRPTMRRAIQVLVDKGLLVRRRGVGTQIVHGAITRGLDLSSLYDDLSQQNRRPATKVLVFEVVPPTPALSERLRVPLEGPVLHLRRLRYADGAPMAVLDNHVLDPSHIDFDSLGRRGLYELLRDRGTTLKVARQLVSARAASTEESELLDMQEGEALLTLDRTAYDHSGDIVELARHVYRPDRYSVEFTVVDK
jgi:DNA-binding GntR family transcriptional regulator